MNVFVVILIMNEIIMNLFPKHSKNKGAINVYISEKMNIPNSHMLK